MKRANKILCLVLTMVMCMTVFSAFEPIASATGQDYFSWTASLAYQKPVTPGGSIFSSGSAAGLVDGIVSDADKTHLRYLSGAYDTGGWVATTIDLGTVRGVNFFKLKARRPNTSTTTSNMKELRIEGSTNGTDYTVIIPTTAHKSGGFFPYEDIYEFTSDERVRARYIKLWYRHDKDNNNGLTEISISEFGVYTKLTEEGIFEEVILEIKEADKDRVGEMFDADNPYLIAGFIKLNGVLQLDLANYLSLESSYKEAVHEALAGEDFSDIDAVKTAFNDAVTYQKRVEIVADTNEESTEQWENLLDFFSKSDEYKNIVNVNLNNEYGYKMLVDLKANNQSDAIDMVYQALVDGRPYKLENLGKIKQVFDISVALQMINIADSRIMGNVMSSNTVLNVDLSSTGTYGKLSDTNKAKVHQDLVVKRKLNNGFETIEEFQDEFDKIVSSVKNSNPPPQNSSSSPRNTITIRPQIPVVVDEPKDEPKNEPKVNFNDLGSVSWAARSIEALVEKGVVNGYADGTFKPEEKVTRAQFIKMLMTGLNLVDNNATSDFKDLNAGEWYYPYVATAHQLGISKGFENNTFGVNDEITRQEMAVLVNRVATYVKANLVATNPSVEFEDGENIADYATESIKVMQQAGIINGLENNRFGPLETATRAQAAKIVYELLQFK